MVFCCYGYRYLGRLDGELDELVSKQGLPHQKGRRHASREDQIRSTMLRERHLLEGPGFGECMHLFCLTINMCVCS